MMNKAKADIDMQVSTEKDDLDSSDHSTQQEQPIEAAPVALADRETRMVNRSKWLVYFVILLSAAVAGTVTYIFTKDEEKRWYEDEFEDFSEQAFESTRWNLEKFDIAIFSLAETVTSHALFTGTGTAAFPNVTLPNFAITARNFATLGNSEAIAVAPLVLSNQRLAWETYAWDHQDWIEQDLKTAAVAGTHEHRRHLESSQHYDDHSSHGHGQQEQQSQEQPGPIREKIYGIDNPGQHSLRHFPVWQMFPTPVDAIHSPVMMDLLGLEGMPPLLLELEETRHHVFSSVVDLDPLLSYQNNVEQHSEDESGDDHSDHHHRQLGEADEPKSPKSLIMEPIFDTFDAGEAQLVGVTIASVEWKRVFSGLLEGEAAGMILDLQHSCPTTGTTSPRYAFQIKRDGSVTYVGENIVHDPQYEHMTHRAAVTGSHGPEDEHLAGEENGHLHHKRTRRGLGGDHDDHNHDSDEDLHSVFGCVYHVSAHATDEFVESYKTNQSVLYSIVVCAIFVFTGLVFLLYDFMVQTRNRKVVRTAQRSTAIVTSLFPRRVAEQMMEEDNDNSNNNLPRRSFTAQALRAINSPSAEDKSFNSATKKPIADLFKEATIMFGDIGGFTAWSSMREPAQVFRLLETIFNAFDTIADRRNVFKVETVGDCYVAVCGIPDPRRDHAVVMARFAWECLLEVTRLTKQLDVELGPDTSNLTMRFGLHSGAVTAGVLRGQRARFQLFGDAVNKASRIETSGVPGKIHMSQETADLLIQRGKGHWVTKRAEMVNLKGLGQVSTCWLNVMSAGSSSVTASDNRSDFSAEEAPREDFSSDFMVRRGSHNRMGYLIPWHTEVLSQFLRKIVAYRAQRQASPNPNEEAALALAEVQALFGKGSPSSSISFPVMKKPVDESSVVLDDAVLAQLGKFVEEIAAAYNPNPFHSFQHASHVVMSVTKLLSHMEATSNTSLDDPMTQFTAVFTALIHDVDHPGVSNGQLVKEGHDLAKMYKSSIAERNSLDVAWSILSQSEYKELRRTIYQTVSEFECFRELLVHSVLVTDLMDKDLQSERKKRWDDVFDTSILEESERNGEEPSESGQDLVNINKQKLALLETLIQTSDVAHTMQHWSVYQHWNKLLHTELREAYEGNRAAKHPSEFWYKGEIGFFDAYIVPLAQRLKDCPAFDASGQELLQYANSNRTEWELKGKTILESWK